MTLKLSELLQASKDALIRDGWCLGITTNEHGEHCAMGAVNVSSEAKNRTRQFVALNEILVERYQAGTFPEVKFGGGMSRVAPAEIDMFMKGLTDPYSLNFGALLVVFNNNSTEREVFQLFNEAIDRAKAAETAEQVKMLKEKQHVAEHI